MKNKSSNSTESPIQTEAQWAAQRVKFYQMIQRVIAPLADNLEYPSFLSDQELEKMESDLLEITKKDYTVDKIHDAPRECRFLRNMEVCEDSYPPISVGNSNKFLCFDLLEWIADCFKCLGERAATEALTNSNEHSYSNTQVSLEILRQVQTNLWHPNMLEEIELQLSEAANRFEASSEENAVH